jgi:ribosomal protein S18 acetylase RimI-like enzyme
MRGDLELKRIYVLSKLHGRGLAADLLDAAIKHARTQNAPRLLLGTYEENHRAMAFYTKHGFETIGTRQFNVGGKIYDDIVMAKPL